MARGFQPWVAIDLMGYDGPDLPEPDPKLIPYADRFFEAVLRLKNEGFYGLRKQDGVKPYNLYGEASFMDDALRRKMLEQREQLLLQGEQLLGLVELSGNKIETIVVGEAAQGQGIGRKLTQYAICRLRERGVARPLLDVGQPNQRAAALYRSLGFEQLQTNQIVRRSIERVE